MNIYKLGITSEGLDQLESAYDINRSLSVFAHNEAHARDIAASVAADEGEVMWFNPEHTWCREIEEPEAGVITIDFKAG